MDDGVIIDYNNSVKLLLIEIRLRRGINLAPEAIMLSTGVRVRDRAPLVTVVFVLIVTYQLYRR